MLLDYVLVQMEKQRAARLLPEAVKIGINVAEEGKAGYEIKERRSEAVPISGNYVLEGEQN